MTRQERDHIRRAFEGHLSSCGLCCNAQYLDEMCARGRELGTAYEASIEVETGGTAAPPSVVVDGAIPVEVIERDDITDKYRTPMFRIGGRS